MAVSKPTFAIFGVLLICACGLTNSPSLRNSTSQGLSKGESLPNLISTTPLVIHARVERVVGRDGTMGRREVPAIYSDLTLKVFAQLGASSPRSPLSLTLLGGRVDDREHRFSDQVELKEGDEFIAFVDPRTTPHPFIGGTRGIFRVVDGLVFSVDGRAVVRMSTEGFHLANRASDPGRLPVGVGTATGFGDPAGGPPLSVAAVWENLARLRAP